MASLSSTVALVFQLDDQATKQIQAIEGRLSAFGKSVSNVADPIANATAALIAFEKAVLGIGLVIGTKAIQAFADFESALVDLNKALDVQGPELDRAKDQLRALAVEYGVSTVEVTGAVAGFAKAGNDLESSLELTRLALEQSIAAEVDAADATKGLIQIQQAFGLSNEELRNKLDKLNTVADSSAVSSEQLLDALARSSLVASKAGLDFETLLANLTPITEATQEGAESGTAFRTVLANLIDPTNSAREALGLLGDNLNKQAFETANAGERLNLLQEALAKSDEKTQLYVLRVISGAEQVSRLSAGVTNLTRVNEVYANQQGELNTVAAEAAKVLNTLAKQFDILDVAVTQVFSSIGAGLVGEKGQGGVADVTNELTRLALAARDAFSSENFDSSVFAPIRAALFDVSEVLFQISENLGPAFDQADLSGFGRAIDALFGDLKGVEISADDLADVITFLSDSFGSLTVVTTEAEKFFIGPLLTGITTVTSAFNALDEDVKRIVGATGGIALLIKLLGPGKAGLLGAITLIQQNKGFLSDVFGTDVDVDKFINFLISGLNNILAIIKDFEFIDKLISETQVTEAVTALELLQKNYGLTASSAEEAFQILGTFGEILRDVDASAGDTTWEAYVNGLQDTTNKTNLASAATSGLNQDLSNINADQAASEIDKFGTATGKATGATDQINAQLEELKSKGPGLADIFGNFGNAAANSASQIEASEERLKAFLITADDGSKVLTNLGQTGLKTFTDTNQAIDASGQQFTDYVKTTETVGGQLVTVYSEVDKSLKTTFDNTSKSIDDATKKSEDFQLKLAELASNEKIKTIEATVQLNIAQIEADTARVEAAFNSINTAIESTGGTIESAFGALGQFAELSEIDLSRNQAFQAILDQLAAENALRQQAFEDQTRLNDAIIDNLRAKTAAFDRGDPLIKIDGTGLEPELRAIMWYMLRAIQVQVNAEFADFLLGLNPDLPPAAPA